MWGSLMLAPIINAYVTLGDGQNLAAVGRGNVDLRMNLPQGKKDPCIHDVLKTNLVILPVV